MTGDADSGAPAGRTGLLLALSAGAFAVLVALGIWQVQRLAWKEALIADIDSRTASAPVALAEIEALLAAGESIEYRPVAAQGRYFHAGERHFFATHRGQSGWYVYTPLDLGGGRLVFVNRGFVPYDRKAGDTRSAGQVEDTVEIAGLARTAPDEKPSIVVPDNDAAGDVFHWKDLDAMTATAGLPAGAEVLPFFIDADAAPNPGGLPIGGVTIVDLPNSHLQYALTWFGLAAALAAVAVLRLRRGQAPPGHDGRP